MREIAATDTPRSVRQPRAWNDGRKEELCGLLAAVERYLKVDHAAEQRELERRVESIRTCIEGHQRRADAETRAGDRQPRGLTSADIVTKL